MATPSLTRHSIPGALGAINIDVRTGDRKNPRPAVVIAHGFKGFKDWGMFPVLADRLAKAGFSVVTFNMSGSGVDDAGDFTRIESFSHNTYSAELDDLGRVMGALGPELDLPSPTAIGLLGHSRGGGISVLHAALDPAVTALVTWAAIGSVDRWSDAAKDAWRRRGYLNIQNTRTGQVIPLSTDVLDDVGRNGGSTLNITAAAARVRAPWLIVHGAADETVAVADATNLGKSARPANRVLILEGASHTFGAAHPLVEISPDLDLAIAESVGWFSLHLR
ncbi:MAG: alpha/beta fold hydrolase [Gemmatimonadota bacterium]